MKNEKNTQSEEMGEVKVVHYTPVNSVKSISFTPPKEIIDGIKFFLHQVEVVKQVKSDTIFSVEDNKTHEFYIFRQKEKNVFELLFNCLNMDTNEKPLREVFLTCYNYTDKNYQCSKLVEPHVQKIFEYGNIVVRALLFGIPFDAKLEHKVEKPRCHKIQPCCDIMECEHKQSDKVEEERMYSVDLDNHCSHGVSKKLIEGLKILSYIKGFEKFKDHLFSVEDTKTHEFAIFKRESEKAFTEIKEHHGLYTGDEKTLHEVFKMAYQIDKANETDYDDKRPNIKMVFNNGKIVIRMLFFGAEPNENYTYIEDKPYFKGEKPCEVKKLNLRSPGCEKVKFSILSTLANLYSYMEEELEHAKEIDKEAEEMRIKYPFEPLVHLYPQPIVDNTYKQILAERFFVENILNQEKPEKSIATFVSKEKSEISKEEEQAFWDALGKIFKFCFDLNSDNENEIKEQKLPAWMIDIIDSMPKQNEPTETVKPVQFNCAGTPEVEKEFTETFSEAVALKIILGIMVNGKNTIELSIDKAEELINGVFKKLGIEAEASIKK